jgi:general secretion pathway protein D
MVFIRPSILRDASDNDALTSRRYNFIRNEQLRRNPEAEPEIDLLVRDYLGIAPPVVVARPDDVTVDGSPISEMRAPDGPVSATDIPPSSAAPPPPASPGA